MKTSPTTSIVVLCAAALQLLNPSTAFLVPNISNKIVFHTRSGRAESRMPPTNTERSTVMGLRNISRRRSRCRPRPDNSSDRGLLATADSEETPVSPIAITSGQIRTRNMDQLQRLRSRDRQSKRIAPEELTIVYEDRWLVVVNKPAGTLCVPSEEGIPTLAQTVFETVPNQQSSLDRMVVHRLGMDTSGLVIFAKDMEALRGMNTLFRTRKIERKYEALVCGHLANDSGTIDLPLMRDYEKPPFMRVSTAEHQKVLLGLDEKVVGKKLMEAPKASRTMYEVVSRETFGDTDLPVTRLSLTSVTGRTHQLNVHMAAIGHPIVGDKIYGWKGDAVPNGGLELEELSSAMSNGDSDTISTTGFATPELQEAIGAVATRMCVHAKSLSFHHPIFAEEDRDPLYFECPARF